MLQTNVVYFDPCNLCQLAENFSAFRHLKFVKLGLLFECVTDIKLKTISELCKKKRKMR